MVVSAVVAVYLTRSQVAPSISLAPTTFVAVQGTPIAFTVFGLESNGIATVYFGDGHEANTTSTVSYAYPNPGRYLIAAQEYVNDQPVSSTFDALQTIQVTPQVSVDLAPLISVPSVSFDVSRNPSAPVVKAGDSVYVYGDFLEAPSGANMTIIQYAWDFGNGANKTVAVNSTPLKPTENPAETTYGQPGLYAVTLRLVTENSTSMATYSTFVEQTIAVSSSSQHYALYLYAGSVPNPSVINVAEYVVGGPDTLDPDIANNIIALEPVINIISTLIIWNGSSTTNFIPMAAAQIPSLSNGGISPDYTTYTFHIRSDLRFSNGDPITAYDVWYSMIRFLLFAGGAPGTPGYPMASWLISGTTYGYPVMANASDTRDYHAIMNAVTYSNSSNTVTFRFVKSITPQLFFDVMPTNILDSRWLEQIGAGIMFSPAGFYAYQNQANSGSYNLKVQYDPVASGPYMIQSYTPGQSITLVPNPGFPGISGVPAVNDTVVIQWIRDPETAFNLFRSGQADIVSWLLGGAGTGVPAFTPQIKQQVANGQAKVYQFPGVNAWFYGYNLAVNETALKTDFGSQYHIPSAYFANLDVRKAFAYAFNYTNYIDVIQGNAKYGIDFGDGYAGLIAHGVPGYVPESQFLNTPTYNLTYAKQLMLESGEYNVSINIPIVLLPGDPVNFAGAQMWAGAINSIDPNIVMTPMYASSVGADLVYQTPGVNPMPIYDWSDFGGPDPSFPVDYGYKEGGGGTAPNGWSVGYLNSTGHPDQAVLYAQMNSLIAQADSTTNATLAAQDYQQMEQIAVELYMYVYTVIPSQFWVVKPYMTGYQGQISYQMNPVFGGSEIGQYYWWVKGCENPQACSGRNIGP